MLIKNKIFKKLIDVIKYYHTSNKANKNAPTAVMYVAKGQLYVSPYTEPNVIVRLGAFSFPDGYSFSISSSLFDCKTIIKNNDVNIKEIESGIHFFLGDKILLTPEVISDTQTKNLLTQPSIFSYSNSFDGVGFRGLIKKHKDFLPPKSQTINDEYRCIYFRNLGNSNVFEVQTINGHECLVTKNEAIEALNTESNKFILPTQHIKLLEKIDYESIKIHPNRDNRFCINLDNISIFVDFNNHENEKLITNMLSKINTYQNIISISLDMVELKKLAKNYPQEYKEEMAFVFFKHNKDWFIRNADSSGKEIISNISAYVSEEDLSENTKIVFPSHLFEKLNKYERLRLHAIRTNDGDKYPSVGVFKDLDSEDIVLIACMRTFYDKEEEVVEMNEEPQWSDL